jgi:hypothetical protein
MFTIWIDNDPELMELDRKKLENDFELLEEEYHNIGRKLFSNFLKIAEII